METRRAAARPTASGKGNAGPSQAARSEEVAAATDQEGGHTQEIDRSASRGRRDGQSSRAIRRQGEEGARASGRAYLGGVANSIV